MQRRGRGSRPACGEHRLGDRLPTRPQRPVRSTLLPAAYRGAAEVGHVAGVQHSRIDHHLVPGDQPALAGELAVGKGGGEGPGRVAGMARDDAEDRLDVTRGHATAGHGREEPSRELHLAHAGRNRRQHVGDGSLAGALRLAQERHLLVGLDGARREEHGVGGFEAGAGPHPLEREPGSSR